MILMKLSKLSFDSCLMFRKETLDLNFSVQFKFKQSFILQEILRTEQPNNTSLVDYQINHILTKSHSKKLVKGIACLSAEPTSADIRADLHEIVRKYNLTTSCVEDILAILKKHGHVELPGSYRSLMKTPRSKTIFKDIAGGAYYHIGLKNILTELAALNLITKNQQTVLSLTVHIDGISLAKSSSLKSWTILGEFQEINIIKPFLIGLFVGYDDPHPFDNFLQEFCIDIEKGSKPGLELEGNCKVIVHCVKILSDSMARLKLTHSLGPQGLRGCYCCTQLGKTIDGRVQYKSHIVLPLRTDNSFRQRHDLFHHHEEYRTKMSLLENPKLGFDMVMTFPIDGMHQGDFGAFGRSFKVIMIDKYSEGMRITQTTIDAINLTYQNLYSYAPIEFKRKPRDLVKNFKNLKATELRNISLYYGFVIFRHLSDAHYKHYLLYALSIRLYSATKTLTPGWLDVAEKLMALYVKRFRRI